MARIAILTKDELLKGNKRFCLSPDRALKQCYKCKYYGDKPGYSKPCESRIVNPQYDALLAKKKIFAKKHEEEIARLDKQIENLQK
jgi:hypothetical protein